MPWPVPEDGRETFVRPFWEIKTDLCHWRLLLIVPGFSSSYDSWFAGFFPLTIDQKVTKWLPEGKQQPGEKTL